MKRKITHKTRLAEMLAAQIRDVKGMRRMAASLMRKLRRDMRVLSGEKELKHCIEEMARLSQVQLKMIPLETELMQMLLPQQPVVMAVDAKEDAQILERAFQRWQNRGKEHE